MKNKDEIEKEANMFARCLLVPESLLRKEIHARRKEIGDLLNDSNPFLAKLANRFNVPVFVIVQRLIETEILKL